MSNQKAFKYNLRDEVVYNNSKYIVVGQYDDESIWSDYKIKRLNGRSTTHYVKEDQLVDPPKVITMYRYTIKNCYGNIYQTHWKNHKIDVLKTTRIIKTETKEIEVEDYE